MGKKHRIKSKFRFCVFLTAVFFIFISVTGNVVGYNQALSLSKPAYTEIMVVTGDTLWDLAKSYGPNDQDVRKIVYEICKVNNITADILHAGQKILIPKYM